MNVCISRTSAPNEIIDVSNYRYFTIEELKKQIKQTNKSFFIKTRFYCEKLKNDVQPFILYPELFEQTNKIQKYPIPELSLIIKENSEPQYSLFVLIQTQLKDIEFPLMEVKFSEDEMMKLNSKDFLKKCIKSFEFECNDTFLLDSNQQIIDKKILLKDLFLLSKSSHLTFKCTISEKSIEKVNKRKNIIQELIKSEVIFVNNIQILHDYFHPTFSETEMFDSFQLKLIFQEINPILKTHVDLLRMLSKSKNYSSEIGPLFLNYINRFQVTIPFITNYKRADNLIQKKKNSSKNIEKKLTEIASNSPMKDGGDFSSYYITPVQRYPRYTLLIKELAKCTPSFHPDKAYLELAEEALTVINKEIDETSQQIKQQLLLAEIQKELIGNISIIKNDRILIFKKKITIQKKISVRKGVIYLFNDMILIVKREKKKLKPVLFVKLEDFRFCNGLPSNDSFLLSINTNEVTISFKNFDKKSLWMERFDQTRMVYLSTINCETKFIKWTEIEMGQDHFPLMNLDGCFMNDKVYFFGGMNSFLMPCSALIEFNPSLNSWHLKSSHIPARIGHTMTNVNGKCYICFGFNNKNEYFSDLWEFDGNNWKNIDLSEEIHLAFHTTVCHENKLFVFGGKNEYGISNEMLVIDPSNGNIKHIQSKDLPIGRYNHSSVYFDNKMVIIGGETNEKVVGDIFVYDFIQNSWKKIESIASKPRIHHKTVLLKNYIFIIGGVDNDTDNDRLDNECIDPLAWEKIQFNEFGNSPFGNSKFAIAATSKTSAITYGGIDSITKMPLASSWLFDIKDGFNNKY